MKGMVCVSVCIDRDVAEWLKRAYKSKLEDIIKEAIIGFVEGSSDYIEDEGRKWLGAKRLNEVMVEWQVIERKLNGSWIHVYPQNP